MCNTHHCAIFVHALEIFKLNIIDFSPLHFLEIYSQVYFSLEVHLRIYLQKMCLLVNRSIFAVTLLHITTFYSCYLHRHGYMAEPLASWVADRTGIKVCDSHLYVV